MHTSNIREQQKNICDFYCEFNKENISILQITDMQIIDSSQCRTPDRINQEKIDLWSPENVDKNCFNHIRSLITQSNPDLIILTGDLIYGEFDDSGAMFTKFVKFMDSFEIPWAPVFGNHDNESAKGVRWQCEQFENAKYCMFKTGKATGFGNYTIGIVNNGKLIKVLYMLDTHCCFNAHDAENKLPAGLFPDQLDIISDTSKKASEYSKERVSGFVCYHIPNKEYMDAAIEKGYYNKNGYVIGVTCKAKDGDFGFCDENYSCFTIPGYFDFLKASNIDGVFVGHLHKVNTSVMFNGVRLTFGMKTGVYDYYENGQLGGTAIKLSADGKSFNVSHIPCLVPYNKAL